MPPVPTATKTSGETEVAEETQEIRIRAFIDGRDELLLSRSGARWVHQEWAYPNDVELNGVKWNPSLGDTLANSGATQFQVGATSLEGARLTVRRGRGSVRLVQPAGNIVRLVFDDPEPGGDTYELTVSFAPSQWKRLYQGPGREFVGRWNGKWDDTWAVQLTIQRTQYGFAVMYEWEEVQGEPMMMMVGEGQVDGNIFRFSSVEISISPGDPNRAKAIGRFKETRTTELTRAAGN